ncbi:hypothetical protein CPARA_2gp179 (nucleomorph) [Cryptomonas paramecium]|uniref:Uncharacterized protein n=1 Tax=Cryptomonas paramaecium TaxID=2898 RepID=F2HHP1_9CRYP|nr:hypothetical protein CPARA_2gp179 [Cryptomonas paramecium]AEA38837.1 hypothetical protein CPARA_2gp179 [Cryptomonas paramecium]|mmetsp:Transcript_5583/g.17818  ORF Transcript_5583/g.17818 Transcript_5583/m.17818 type:complete len:161 (+) Transcript_5583:5119-5601(+)
MFNEQRTFIPNYFLTFLIGLILVVLVFILTYTYKLIKSLDTDIVNPNEIYEKINNVKIFECVSQLTLFFILIIRGWWLSGFLSFPFVFYNFAQYQANENRVNSNKIFTILFFEIKAVKIKISLLMVIFVYNILAWLTWTPPDYVPRGNGWNTVKYIQISN